MNAKERYDARREALDYASLIEPHDADSLIRYAKAVEAYLTSESEFISGGPSGLAASGRVELGNVD